MLRSFARSSSLYRYCLPVSQTRTSVFDALKNVIDKAGGAEKIRGIMQQNFEGKSKNSQVSVVLGGDESCKSVSISPSLIQEGSAAVEKGVREAIEDSLKQKQTHMLSDLFKGQMGGGGFPQIPK